MILGLPLALRPSRTNGLERTARHNAGMTPDTPARDAGYFDQWYADMAASDVRDHIVASTLGLPADLGFASMLTWDAIADVEEALLLHEGGLLLDVACGRGGYGIEVARRSGAQLVGVGFSAVALRAARASSARLLPEGRAEFSSAVSSTSGCPRALSTR